MAKQGYHVVFDRIGRNHDLTGDFDAADADELAGAIYRFARKHLASRDFAVTVDLEKNTGSIEAGRFGNFVITEPAKA